MTVTERIWIFPVETYPFSLKKKSIDHLPIVSGPPPSLLFNPIHLLHFLLHVWNYHHPYINRYLPVNSWFWFQINNSLLVCSWKCSFGQKVQHVDPIYYLMYFFSYTLSLICIPLKVHYMVCFCNGLFLHLLLSIKFQN